MATKTPHLPHQVFPPPRGSNRPSPRVFLSPQRYIQGAGCIEDMGRYLGLLNAKKAGILMSKRCEQNEGGRLKASLEAAGIEVAANHFGGECSLPEIERHEAHWAGTGINCLIAIGGGKCIDAGKAIAWRLDVPVVIVPSLASNDAPCSAVSVLYTPEGVSAGAEFYPENPALVVMDTAIVASAPERYLVAGMGDAMATWYEAQACARNPRGYTNTFTRPTLAASAIGEACAATLFELGANAARAVTEQRLSQELEDVVEANTLLSGLGFESGGLAGAHGFAQALTFLPAVEHNYLHGEMVAIGTLGQLALERRDDELERVARFFIDVGLPVHLGQIGLDPGDDKSLSTVAEGTVAFPFIANLGLDLDAQTVMSALQTLDQRGKALAEQLGDTAYRRVQGL